MLAEADATHREELARFQTERTAEVAKQTTVI
jgi:hypothetical protein